MTPRSSGLAGPRVAEQHDGFTPVDPRPRRDTERDERASIAIATNAPFSEWGRTFTDPRLAAAVVDRVTYNAHIIETGSDSYRLRATRAAKKTKGAAAT